MNKLTKKIEALLFVAGQELSVQKLSKITNATQEEVMISLEEIDKKFIDGVVLLKNENKYRLATHPEIADTIAEYLHADVTGELTKAQLETLTIIAYRGPIIKTEIEMIRGVNCTVVLRNLMMRGYVEEQDGVLEPSYIITLDFLRYLGVSSVSELPQFEELSDHEAFEQLQETIEQRS